MRATTLLQQKIAKQEAHVARMIAHNPTQPSIKSAKRIVEMYRQQLAALEGKGTR